MNEADNYQICYAPLVKQHIEAIELKYHSLIRTKIIEQLQFEPARETRNRKPLLRPVEFSAEWELRFGLNNRFRVFYRIQPETRTVEILAIGVKIGTKLTIGGQEIKL